jgi:hypothetical protein
MQDMKNNNHEKHNEKLKEKTSNEIDNIVKEHRKTSK